MATKKRSVQLGGSGPAFLTVAQPRPVGGDGKAWGLPLPCSRGPLACSPAPSCMPEGLGEGLGQQEGEPGPSCAATRGLKTRINVLFTEYWTAVGAWG